ncbi:universal stress protein [bacterium]|nr:universal stress protein [bacterium]
MAKSFLLALDGSQEALFAADVAAALTKSKGANLTAQTVVDSQSLWEIVGQDLPGIIGSGPYMAAYQSIEATLRSVAETLMHAFECRIANSALEAVCEIDEGNIIDHILRRAVSHDLVIMGHKSKVRQRSIHQRRYINTSLCQRVADACPVPLLVVQNAIQLWSRSVLLVSAETYCSETIKAFVELATVVGGKAEIVCTGRSKTIDSLIGTVRSELSQEAITDFAADKVSFTVVGRRLYELETFFSVSGAREKDTLIVLTTCDTEQGRKVCTGESLDYVIRDVAAACTLFLPPQKVQQALVEAVEPCATKKQTVLT